MDAVTLSFDIVSNSTPERIHFKIAVSNSQNVDLSGCFIELKPINGFYLSEKKVYVNTSRYATYSCTVLAYSGVDFIKLNIFTFTLKDKSGKEITSIRTGYLIRDLLDFLFSTGKSMKNICCFGPPGSSKSSFINSVFTVLNSGSDVLGNFAISGGNMDHCTLEFRSYAAFDKQKKQKSCIRLLDLWGVDDNFTRAMFSQLLSGAIPNKTKFSDMDTLGECVDERLKPNCIIFFVPASDLIAETYFVDLVAERINDTIRAKIGVCVCISRVDESNEKVRKDSISQNDCASLISIASKRFGIAKNKIAPLINYVEETKRSLIQDLWIYRVLEMAMKQAESNSLSEEEMAMMDS